MGASRGDFSLQFVNPIFSRASATYLFCEKPTNWLLSFYGPTVNVVSNLEFADLSGFVDLYDVYLCIATKSIFGDRCI